MVGSILDSVNVSLFIKLGLSSAMKLVLKCNALWKASHVSSLQTPSFSMVLLIATLY